MLHDLDSVEISEWQAYEAYNGPLGELRFDYLFASVAHMLAEINRDEKKRSTPFKVEDFLIFKPELEADEEEPWEKTMRAMKALGG